jgi:predicted PurR-regulated permease PerM
LATLSPPQPIVKRFGVRTLLIALASLVALLYFGRDFFVTLIISIIFAFILDPAVLLVMKLRLPRPAATGIVIGVALIGVYITASIAWAQLSILAEDLPTYASRVSELWSSASDRLDQFEKSTADRIVPQRLRDQDQQIQQKPQQAMQARRRRAKQPELPAPSAAPVIQEVRIHTDPKPFITTLYTFSFVPFLVYFMLSWRDHLNKSMMRLFRGNDRYVVGKTLADIGDSTRAYVLGNFLLWVFLSSMSAVAFFFLGIPYWPLVGFVSAFFSLMPYFGLPLSLIPPVLAAVAIPNRLKIILTVILITATLHLIAMNFLYAKMIGRRVRLNPLVVTVALMFWGLIWGGIGLVLAVPITAAVKTVCDNVESLQPYGRLLGD